MRPTISPRMIRAARTTPRQAFDARREGRALAAYQELSGCDCRAGLSGLASESVNYAVQYGTVGATYGGAYGAAIGAAVGAIYGAFKKKAPTRPSVGDKVAAGSMNAAYQDISGKILGRDIPLSTLHDLFITLQTTGAICCAQDPRYFEGYWQPDYDSIVATAKQAVTMPVGSPITPPGRAPFPNPGPDAKLLLPLWGQSYWYGQDKFRGNFAGGGMAQSFYTDVFDHALGDAGAPLPSWAPSVYRTPPPAAAAPSGTGIPKPFTQPIAPYVPTGFAPPSVLPANVLPATPDAYNKPGIPAAVPSTPAPVPNLTPQVADQTSKLIDQLLAQGATQSQAFSQAIASLQSQGVQATPQVQAAVQSEVTQSAAPTNMTPWLIAAGIGAAFLLGKK